jgi:hypothetical protein
MASVVGIDFGYQNSLIAAAGRGGVDVLLNGNSQRLNPYVELNCLYNDTTHNDNQQTLTHIFHNALFSCALFL